MSLELAKRALLATAILDISLQIDKYFMYHDEDAMQGSIGGINISLTTACLVGLYGLWLVEAAMRPAQARSIRMIALPAILYMSAVAFSAASAEYWLLCFFDLALLAQAYLLLIYVANQLSDRKDVTFIMGVLAATLMLQALFVFAGYVRGESLSLGPIEIVHTHDLETTGIYGMEVDDGSGRACGTIGSPVTAGSFMALLFVPVGVTLLLPSSRSLKLLAAAAVVLGAPAIVLTGTRGAVISVAISSCIVGTLAFRRGWLTRPVLLAGLCAGMLSTPLLTDLVVKRVLHGDKGSASARVHLSKIGCEIIRDNPLLGVGAGNCHRAMVPYASRLEYRGEWLYTIHSKYLLVWAETGTLGMFSFVLFLGEALYVGWLNWRSTDRVVALTSLALAAAVFGQMVHMAVDVFNSRPGVQLLWCCIGLILGLHRLGYETMGRPDESGALSHVG